MRKRLTNIFTIVCTVALCCACSAVTEEMPNENVRASANYVNFAIAVTNSDMPATRANEPMGGEDGDGREYGFDRENAIAGITLILYQSATGINATDDPVINFAAYYPVTRTTKDTNARIEATYTTGNQLVPQNSIDFTKTYHAIVVANADLTGSITPGTTTLSSLRNQTLSSIYTGDETWAAQQCYNFVMSSEQDNTLTFSGKGTRDTAGDIYYDMSESPLVIERMAARIDFWAVNGTYNSTYHGYVYNVKDNATDKFVVTAIMPFNLQHKHSTYGNEYLLKRLTANYTTVTPQWLVDESTTNYVIDPKTTEKVSASHPKLVNELEDVTQLAETNFRANTYYKTVDAMHTAVSASGTTAGYTTLSDNVNSTALSGEDVVVAYPMENTLLPGVTPLYYHATGIAIEGYYYAGGLESGTPTRCVYYGYLRHQGDSESYEIQTTNNTDELSSSATAMNMGIVRNNIYRVWIGGIDSKGSLDLHIKVKKWDKFTHATIYM